MLLMITMSCFVQQLCLKNTRSKTEEQIKNNVTKEIQGAQLSQRDRAAGCVIVLAKSGRLELGYNILRTLYV